MPVNDLGHNINASNTNQCKPEGESETRTHKEYGRKFLKKRNVAIPTLFAIRTKVMCVTTLKATTSHVMFFYERHLCICAHGEPTSPCWSTHDHAYCFIISPQNSVLQNFTSTCVAISSNRP